MSEQALLAQTVLYTMTENDVQRVIDANPLNGNMPRVGEQYSARVLRVWGPDSVNLRVELDGPNTLWVTSVSFGDTPGTWQRTAW